MKPCRNILILLAALLTAIGAAAAEKRKNELPAKVKAILDKAEQFELLSLDPNSDRPNAKDHFHGWYVLGKTIVKKAETRKQILDALEKGISDRGRAAKCFEPRHGIRATSSGKTVDLVICFECGQVYHYFGDEAKGTTLFTTSKPQATLDGVLKDAKVPLPKVLVK
jgi:hypothetical protein